MQMKAGMMTIKLAILYFIVGYPVRACRSSN
jgi:hypothetical protein